MRQNSHHIDQYGKAIGEAIREILEKYKSSGEENLSTEVLSLPNMYSKKEAIHKTYPKGLYGFFHNLKQKIYALAG